VYLRDAIDYLQFVVVLVVCFLIWRNRPARRPDRWTNAAARTGSVQRFSHYWLLLWLRRVALYALYPLHPIPPQGKDAVTPQGNAAITFFVNATSVALLGLYREMSRPMPRRQVLRAAALCSVFTALEEFLFCLVPPGDVSPWFGFVAGLLNALFMIR